MRFQGGEHIEAVGGNPDGVLIVLSNNYRTIINDYYESHGQKAAFVQAVDNAGQVWPFYELEEFRIHPPATADVLVSK